MSAKAGQSGYRVPTAQRPRQFLATRPGDFSSCTTAGRGCRRRRSTDSPEERRSNLQSWHEMISATASAFFVSHSEGSF